MSHREDASVALVVPTYPKHFPQAVNLAKSVARYVINSMMLYVATTDAEREAFTAALAQASTPTVSLQDAANVTVRTLWEACQCGADAGGDRDFLAENERQLRAGGSGLMDKFVMQSSKKVLGAMCVNARFVLLTDSESIFVRQVDLAADALRLASWPRRILYDSPARPRNSDWRRNIGSGVRSTALSTVEQFFNVSTGHRYYGFSLGYYWLFSRELVRDFLVYCRRSRHGSYWRSVLKLAVSNNPLNDLVESEPARVWFGELALFVFMLHVHPKRANYLPTDAQALLTTFVPRLAVFQTEHLHCCVRKEHHAGLARLYASLNGSWPVWMADTDPALHDGTLGLLRSTKQIYLLTSQQAGFVEYAIGVGDEWASSSGRPSRGARQPAAADETASSQSQFCPTPEPDVALLVGGMERGLLSEPRMWLSLRRNVLDQFAPRTSELLLFLKTFEWQVGDAWQPSSSRGSLLRTSTATDEEAARRTWARALEVLRPTAVEFANQSEVDALQLRLSRCHKYTPGDGIRPMLGYLHTLQQLWRLTTKREKERGSPFETVMFMRPDKIHYFPAAPTACTKHERRSTTLSARTAPSRSTPAAATRSAGNSRAWISGGSALDAMRDTLVQAWRGCSVAAARTSPTSMCLPKHSVTHKKSLAYACGRTQTATWAQAFCGGRPASLAAASKASARLPGSTTRGPWRSWSMVGKLAAAARAKAAVAAAQEQVHSRHHRRRPRLVGSATYSKVC